MAKLTEELRNIDYRQPTSWVHFKGTQYCPKWKVDNNAKDVNLSNRGEA